MFSLHTYFRLIAFSNKIIFFFAIYGKEAKKETPVSIFFLTYKSLPLHFFQNKTLLLRYYNCTNNKSAIYLFHQKVFY